MDLAAAVRTTVDPLRRPIRLSVRVGDFFDQVRRLEETFPQRARVGTADSVRDEPVRFGASIRLGCPTHDIELIGWEESASGQPRCRMTVTFLGLTGVVSPLPPEYVREILIDEELDGDQRVRAFLDVFHHRAISLFYRAWVKYRPALKLDVSAALDTTRLMLALGGIDVELGSAGPGENAGQELRRLLPISGALSRRVRSALGAEACLSEQLGGVKVSVQPWLLRHVPIPEDQRCRLGENNCALGGAMALGEQVPDRRGRCGVRIGPLSLATFQTLVPGTPQWTRLRRVLHLCLPVGMEYQVSTVLAADEVPEPLLGSSAFGRTSWLGVAGEDDLEVRFSPEDAYSAGTLAETSVG